MGDLTVDPARSISWLIRGEVDPLVERVAHATMFSRLAIERMEIAWRRPDGGLDGKGNFVVHYAPIEEWSAARSQETIGEWVYGEWSDKRIDKALESGGVVSGTRIVIAQGKAMKAGNGTGIAVYRLGVGLVENVGGLDRFIHFVAAANMSGMRDVTSMCPEEEFYLALSGFIESRKEKMTAAIYPLKRGGRGS
jgi:hypothetical protein